MILLCPRCQRVNPDEAAFCHFDGAELRAAPGRDDAQKRTRLPHEFVFPTGRRCQTFDELARGCQEEWEVARDLLRQGVFQQFLTSAGRMDLARTANQAKSEADPDIALESFISSLPAKQPQAPRLDLNPRRLDLGTLHVGDLRQLRLSVLNQGKGLLHGSLAVSEGNAWLKVGNDKSNGECLIKTAKEQQITVRVDSRGLTAPNKYAAKLTVITNGGIVEVPVRMDLAVHPFPKAPFQGAASPRDMAERMRVQPKPAVPLLENGDLARWFAVNGWTFPVVGPTAKGVAAVQQFFEGMGLSKPPTVELAAAKVQLTCLEGEVVAGQITLRTDAKKWVYARAESDAPWLRIATPAVSGPQQAVITFDADSHGLPVNRLKEAIVKLIANAGQTLTAQVLLNVQGRPEAPTTRLVRPFTIGAAAGLLFRLLLVFPADVYGRVLAAKPGAALPAGSFASWLESPVSNVDYVLRFVKATWWLGAVAGAVVLWRRGDRKSDVAFGLVAGAVAGLALSATLACILPALDLLPRFCWQQLAIVAGWQQYAGPPWLWTPVWIGTAIVSWTVMGAVGGFWLGCLGQLGRPSLGALADALSWCMRLCGLKQIAARFTAH